MKMLQMFLDTIRNITAYISAYIGKIWRVKTGLTYVLRAKTISRLSLLVDSFPYFLYGSVYMP